MRNGSRSFPQIIKPLFLGLFVSVFLSMDFKQMPKLSADGSTTLIGGLLDCFHLFGTVWMFLPFAIAGVVYYAGKRQKRKPFQNHIGLCAVSIAFGIFNTLGQELYYFDHILLDPPGWILMCFYAFSCAVLFYYVGLIALVSVPLLMTAPNDEKTVSSRKVFLISFVVILAGWLPWMIAYYPFSADWDVYYPISEYLGINAPTNSIPWFYCCTVGFFYALGNMLGDKNVGIFIFVVLRALIMSAIYANTAARLHSRGAKRGVVCGIVLFYAIVPVWGAYAKHGFKDTLFASLFCLYVTALIDTVDRMRKGEVNFRSFACFAVSSLLICLHRNNGILIAAPVTALLIIAALVNPKYRKRRLRVCAVFASGLVLYAGYMFYIVNVAHVSAEATADVLTIPIQQTARTVRDHADEITAEEREVINSVLDYDTMAKSYDPLISDPVKTTSHFRDGGVMNYARVWLGMFFKYPISYLEAAIGQSYGYYAFTPDQALHAGNWNCGMTIFNWVKDPRFSADFTCDYVDALENVRVFLDDWAKLWHQLPLLGLTDMKAVYTWLIVLVGLAMIRKKRRLALIPVFACILNILLCCASPVNDCFRYFCPIAAAAPALLLLIDSSPCPNRPE